MKKFALFLVGGIAAAAWALYLVLVQVQADLSLKTLYRPSWFWLLVVLAVALIVTAVLSFPKRKRAPAHPTVGTGANEPAAAPTNHVDGSLRASVAGVTEHGRLRASLQTVTPRRHAVTWKETGSQAGALEAAPGGVWNVLDEHGAHLGQVNEVVTGLVMIDLAALNWRITRSSSTPGDDREPPTLVDPSRATLGRKPTLLGVDFLQPNAGGPFSEQRYRTEAWQLTNGDRVVIVSDNGGTSLMNNSENIADAIDARWSPGGRKPIIIEEWDPPTVMGHRFVVSNRAGGHLPVDFEGLARSGIVLPTSAPTAPTQPRSGLSMHTSEGRVSAYHSSNPSDPDIHHVYADCVTGKQIPAINRVSGTGGYRMCEHCRQR